MRVSTNFAGLLAPLLFGLLLLPLAAVADTYANCPAEPATNVPIALGETFAGTNCTLHTPGDVDSFVFDGTNGDTYQLAVAINGAAPTNICLTLYNPSAVPIFSGCTNLPFTSPSVVTDLKLTVTGSYTMVITETSTATLNYGVSLQRLYRFPPDATPVPKLAQSLAGNITPLTDSDAFTFVDATTGKYRVTATMTSSNSNLCMTVYFSNFTVAGSGCTNLPFTSPILQFDFTPTTAQAGTTMAFLQVAGNDSTATYTLEVSCLVGYCPPFMLPPPPPCTLTDAASYNPTSSTLTMKFTIGNNLKNLGKPANWSAWLTYADNQGTNVDTMQPLFSVLLPITNPPKTITKTLTGLPKEGVVGVLSTISTTANGIACSNWVQVPTGTDPN